MNDSQDKPLLIDCPACDAKVSSQAIACPRCGQPITGQSNKTRFGQPTKDVVTQPSSTRNNQSATECPHCKTRVVTNEKSCPMCGQRLYARKIQFLSNLETKGNKRSPLFMGCLGFLLLSFIGGMLASLTKPTENTQSPQPSPTASSVTVNSKTTTEQPAAMALDEVVAGVVIKRYLSENLNDPSSLEDFQVLSISPAKKVPGVYKVAVAYRAKNGFGALVLQKQGFVLSKGGESITGWIALPVKD